MGDYPAASRTSSSFVTDEETEVQRHERNGDPGSHSSLRTEMILESRPVGSHFRHLQLSSSPSSVFIMFPFLFLSCVPVFPMEARRACNSAASEPYALPFLHV